MFAKFVVFITVLSSAFSASLIKHEGFQQPKVQSAVYFPAIPTSLTDFSSGRSAGSNFNTIGKSFGRRRSEAPLFTTPKPTTTTDSLPLATMSHVTRNVTTEAPGPQYLTDSVYYNGDPTPNPDSAEQPIGQILFVRNSKSSQLTSTGLGDEKSVFLQDLLHFSPTIFGQKTASSLFVDTSRLYYIPNTLDESDEQEPDRQLDETFSKEDTIEITHNFEPKRQEQEKRFHTHIPKKVMIVKRPIGVVSSKTRKIRINRPNTRQNKRQDSPEKQENIKKTIRITPPKEVHRFSDHFASKISQPILEPANAGVYSTISFPPKLIHNSKISKPFIPKKVEEKKTVLKTEVPEILEIYVPDSSSEEVHEFQRDYGHDYNSPSGSSLHSHFQVPKVDFQKAPVYRTTTKTYRPPSSFRSITPTSEEEASVEAQPGYVKSGSNIYVPNEYDESAVPGTAGVDYPNYSLIPDTNFKCEYQRHRGIYADQETQCQVFHICQDGGREDSFLCPNGTVFNQQYFVCDWWYNFSCEQASRFYSLNEFLYTFDEKSLPYDN